MNEWIQKSIEIANAQGGKEGNAIRIAVFDGVVWIKGSTKMYRTLCQLRKVALTALLLKDFLESLNRNR